MGDTIEGVPLSRRRLLAASLCAGASAAAVPLFGACAPAVRPASIFDADLAQGFSKYPATNPPGLVENTDFGLTDDPAGSGRTVAWFNSVRGLTQVTPYPRSSMLSPGLIKPAAHGVTDDVYWVGMSVYLPAADVLTEPDSWCAFGTPAFGYPFAGPSPMGMTIVPDGRGGQFMQMGGDPNVLGGGAPVRPDSWTTVAFGFRFAYDGWVEMYLGQGLTNELERVLVNGQRRADYATMKAGSNDGWVSDESKEPCYTSIGVYGPQKMTLLFAHHKAGRSLAEVLPG